MDNVRQYSLKKTLKKNIQKKKIANTLVDVRVTEFQIDVSTIIQLEYHRKDKQ